MLAPRRCLSKPGRAKGPWGIFPTGVGKSCLTPDCGDHHGENGERAGGVPVMAPRHTQACSALRRRTGHDESTPCLVGTNVADHWEIQAM